jgi:hypothetical protein
VIAGVREGSAEGYHDGGVLEGVVLMRAAKVVRRQWRVLPLMIMATACATPYQRRGFTGGYVNEQIGEDTHYIAFDGNGYTGQTTAEIYVRRRAGELCPHGYDILDGASNSETTGAFVHHNQYTGLTTATAINKPRATVTVRCHVARADAYEEPDGLARRIAREEAARRSPAARPPRDLAFELWVERRAYVKEFDDYMQQEQPPARASVDGDDAEVLVIWSEYCGVANGLLPELMAQPGNAVVWKRKGFKWVECRGGVAVELESI